MRRKIISILGMLLAAGMLAGCAKEESTDLREMDVEKYVTLGEYKGLQVVIQQTKFSESDVQGCMEEVYQQLLSKATGLTVEDGITDRAVEEGDVVNMDYEGKKDGVAFGGGTARGAYLGIGSGRFIEGFEEGLVGVMPGETRDLNLKFPEGYSNAGLAGQEVVFTVTVNYIMPEGYHRDILSLLGIEGVTDEDSFREYCRADMEAKDYQNTVRDEVMAAFMEQCTFGELPEPLVEKYREQLKSNIESFAAYADVETVCRVLYGMGMEEVLDTQAPERAKLNLAIQAVANREGLNITEEELQRRLSEEAQAAGITGELPEDFPIEEYREYYLYEKVVDYLIQNAVITY